jgi:hypothetical protein
MPSVGFEPTIPASERGKPVHAIDREATVTGEAYYLPPTNKEINNVCSFISMSLQALITYLSSFFTCKWNAKLHRRWLLLQMQDLAFLYNTFNTWRFPEIPVLEQVHYN